MFLEPGESMSVRDMVKSICIASANDAMVAMAEKVGGSNDHFVAMMNDKAKELKLSNSHFMNATGLHDPEHYTCAKDMLIIARALIAEGGRSCCVSPPPMMPTSGETDKKFWLVNTNKLLKQYEGVDGLKTGFTTEAMSCITVTAKKKDLRLVAVAMGEPSSKQRNAEIKQMLDYGFSQYAQGLLYPKGTKLKTYTMENGKPSSVNLVTLKDLVYVFERGSEPKEQKKKEITITKDTPPYKAMEAIGTVKITMSDGYTMEAPVGVDQDVEQLNYPDIFMKAFSDTLA